MICDFKGRMKKGKNVRDHRGSNLSKGLKVELRTLIVTSCGQQLVTWVTQVKADVYWEDNRQKTTWNRKKNNSQLTSSWRELKIGILWHIYRFLLSPAEIRQKLASCLTPVIGDASQIRSSRGENPRSFPGFPNFSINFEFARRFIDFSLVDVHLTPGKQSRACNGIAQRNCNCVKNNTIL